MFQSTLPTRGSDFYGKPFVLLPWVSIHAPHEGERPLEIYSHLSAQKGFNPRSPRGGATRFCHYREVSYGVSIHAPHEGERRGRTMTQYADADVSIHAPHEGERRCIFCGFGCHHDVSIHAPHEGERPCPILPFAALYRFQSTLPTRGSDVPYCSIYGEIQEFQSTLPTRGSDISFAMRAKQRRMSFNPRSPRGGATI